MKNSLKIMVTINLFFIITLIAGSVFAGISSLDTSFNAAAYGLHNGFVKEIVEQPDGKVLIGGWFTEANGRAMAGIARLNVDGTADAAFNPPDFYYSFNNVPGGLINAIALQSDGKILVAGENLAVGDNTTSSLFRLNPDGSLDSTFISTTPSIIVYDIETLPDDSIIFSGFFGLQKSNPDGSFNNAVSTNIATDIEILPNGKILVSSSGSSAMKKFNSDLTIDTSFTHVTTAMSAAIDSFEILPNGQMIVGGNFNDLNGFALGRIARLNSDGTIDFSFNSSGIGANGIIVNIDVKSDGKIAAGGYFTSFNAQAHKYLVQLNSDGSIDSSFQQTLALDISIHAISYTSNGGLIAGFLAGQTLTEFTHTALLKFNPNGSVDSTFLGAISRYGIVNKIEQKADGKIYVGGWFKFLNGLKTFSIGRLNSDGTADTSFSAPNFGLFTKINGFDVQSNGKVIIATSIGLRRLNANGSNDTTFITDAIQTFDVKVLPDDKILSSSDFLARNPETDIKRLRRLNANGSLDTSFDALLPNNTVNKIAVQPDGKILIVGSFTQIGLSSPRGRIARYNANGSFDTTFNPPGGANGIIKDVDVQSDGKIIVGGEFTSLNGNGNQKRVGRFNSNGSVDTSFISDSDGTVNAVRVQSDGKILIGGAMNNVSNSVRKGFARLNANGSLDNSISASFNFPVQDIDVQPDNKILLGGEFSKIDGRSSVRVARLLSSTVPLKTDYDFDGDGSADIGVFRPSGNIWYQLLGPSYNFSQTSFGASGDIVAPADFDGDGKTDIAIFRPSNGNWWYLSSLTNIQTNVQFGQNGDIPRPTDFDGDGKADFIVFRPTTSQWLRFGSTVGVSNVNFGLTGDKPLIGDFDGDGKSDVAIYRPSTGDWWWQSSLDNSQRATHWGISTDIPSPGDYDGDGITDFAVYRPSTGIWYIYNSSTQQATIIQFGITEDKPIPADYDGDGKVDIAVYRPSTGVWYLLRSTAGFQAIQFGIITDIPIPNALIP